MRTPFRIRSIHLAALLTTAAFATPALAGSIEAAEFNSPTLKRSWTYNVYLPSGYDANAKLRYPVMYLLHGNDGARNDWPVKGNLLQTADQLIANGQIPPAIIVMPDAGTTWYVDLKEPMETAFFNDFVPHIEGKYRTLKSRDGRVIGGLSIHLAEPRHANLYALQDHETPW